MVQRWELMPIHLVLSVRIFVLMSAVATVFDVVGVDAVLLTALSLTVCTVHALDHFGSVTTQGRL